METNRVETHPTVDDLLRRWQSVQAAGRAATVQDLCADSPEKTADLKERLQALASMMRLLGLAAEPDPTGCSSGETVVPEGSSTTTGSECSGLDVDPAGPARSVRIPGYEVLGELGRGGMGVVYLARQISLNRVVALKEILIGDHASPSQLARFRQEGLTVARLRHPNIVQVYEVGEHDGLPFITFEYIRGSSLDRKLTGEPMPSSQAAALIAALARGVSVAHEIGIVHRDLKPGNILLDDQLPGVPGLGVPKVTDFGLAKLVNDQSGLTQTDTVLGSPSYMAPEQAEGKTREVGPAADIYALGAILYELLTGRPPFRGATVLDTIQQVKADEPVPPSQLVPGLHRDAETIALKCLQKDPSRRYSTAGAVADDLDRFLRGDPIAARPIGPWERGGRWCRRYPAVAGLLFAVSASLLLGSLGSLGFALQANSQRRLAERARENEASQRRVAQRQLVELSASSGLAASRQRDEDRALLWFVRAAEFARDAPEQEDLNRTRVANWMGSDPKESVPLRGVSLRPHAHR
jgi:eukaryotic-like serine/threonine-protein kinase